MKLSKIHKENRHVQLRIAQEIAALEGQIAALEAKKPPNPAKIKKLSEELDQKLLAFEKCKEGVVAPGVFLCNDGALYYLRQVGNKIFWFSEHRNGSFANVFLGERTGNEISGRWFDVPKGANQGRGNLKLAVNPATGAMTRKSASGGFSGVIWEPHKPLKNPGLAADSSFRRAGFQGARNEDEDIREADLTGTWLCNDGGTYYIRQVGNDIVWFAESTCFSNVFFGTRSGSVVTGTWADVPKNGATNSGTLTLGLESPLLVRPQASLARTSATGGFLV